MGNLKEYCKRISIVEIAEYLNYEKISGKRAENLTYVLGNTKNPEDEIVLFPAKNTYFSRKGNFDDKGGIVNFVLHRLHLFSGCTQTGYNGVEEVLSKMLNQSLTPNKTHSTSIEQANKTLKNDFNVNYWDPQPIKKDNSYLIDRRKLSAKTVDNFSRFIYTVGKHRNIAFPFRKPGQMEIVNFEMRNYFPATNTNYKAFATGGDKSQSCWIANFVPFNEVTDIYLFESAIDAMSFYEINHFNKETTSAFISTGGYVTKTQIESIKALFTPEKINWHCCFDKDGSGNGFDVATEYYLKGEDCKIYKRTMDNISMVFISFPTGESLTLKESDFISSEFLKSRNNENVINIIKPPKYKDWNELLAYYKRFDCNLGPGMKFIPAIEDTLSQLSLRGFQQLRENIEASSQNIINSFLKQTTYCLSAPLAESSVYTLMVDCNIFMGIDTIILVPTNIHVFDKSTQQTVPAYSINEFLKKEYINIFNDLTSNDFKNLLEKQTLTYTKGKIEKKYNRVVSPSGWNLSAATALKKKDLDIELSL